MATHIFNRDGGETNEAGHLKFVTSAFVGNVLDGLVVKQNSPLSLGVLIEPGTLKIDYSDYGYTGDNDADALVTIATADSSNPRIDRIVAYVDRGMTPSPASPNNPGMLKFMAVSGTPAGSPARPSSVTVNSAVGASNPWCDLADVLVGTGVTTIDNGKITDKRVFATIPPERRSGGFKHMVIDFSGDGTGVISKTGVGFRPKAATVAGNLRSSGSQSITSSGSCSFDGSSYSQIAFSSYSDTTGDHINMSQADNFLLALNGSSPACLGKIISFDADGATFDISTNTGGGYSRFSILFMG